MTRKAIPRTLIASRPVTACFTATLAAITLLAVLIPVGTETQGGGAKNPPSSLRTVLQSPVS